MRISDWSSDVCSSDLSLLNDALALRELLDSAESGRFWYENDLYFNPDNRVDSVLLANLLMAFRSLKDELGTDGAQALLMQTMFVAYLEDRAIIGEAVFRDASPGRFRSEERRVGTEWGSTCRSRWAR